MGLKAFQISYFKKTLFQSRRIIIMICVRMVIIIIKAMIMNVSESALCWSVWILRLSELAVLRDSISV
jgi:hypothetical protein